MKIGLTCRKEDIDGINKIYVNNGYLKLLKRFNLIPLFLNNENVDCLIELCDCVLILGGYDLSPSLYHQENVSSYGVNEELDSLDFKILDYCVKKRIPCLGICRGIQVINVFFNGSLCQNISKNHFKSEVELLDVNNKSRFFEFDSSQYVINSYHHQGIDKVGNDLVVLGLSDGVVEMLEHRYLPIVGVQWHIEKTNNQFNNYLFKTFINLVR